MYILVYSTVSLQITLDDLEYLSTVVAGSNLDDPIETGAYPSTITYHVDSNRSTTQHSLKCVIDVTGASRELKYTLTSTTPTYRGIVCSIPIPCSIYTNAYLSLGIGEKVWKTSWETSMRNTVHLYHYNCTS